MRKVLQERSVQHETDIKYALTGGVTGLLNGIFGAGGGLLAVPMLKKSGLTAKKAHATSIAITLPLSLLSAVLLFFGGIRGDIWNILLAAAAGLPGAWLGSRLLKRIDPSLLKRIFGGVMILSAVRLFFR